MIPRFDEPSSILRFEVLGSAEGFDFDFDLRLRAAWRKYRNEEK